MKTVFLTIDDTLRANSRAVGRGDTLPRVAGLCLIIFFFGIIYGAVMGSFGGVGGDRFLQLAISGIKVPLLLMITFVLSLPSFFVINTLLGLRSDFAFVIRAVMTTQAGLTIILASLAPFTALWYVSTSNYRASILFNMLMFATASIASQKILRRLYRPLTAKNPRHLLSIKIWLLTYSFIAVQMAWVLRPFIGSPSMTPQFFRQEAWSNAYIALARIIVNLFAGN
jgi:hypothetical protein